MFLSHFFSFRWWWPQKETRMCLFYEEDNKFCLAFFCFQLLYLLKLEWDLSHQALTRFRFWRPWYVWNAVTLVLLMVFMYHLNTSVDTKCTQIPNFLLTFFRCQSSLLKHAFYKKTLFLSCRVRILLDLLMDIKQ